MSDVKTSSPSTPKKQENFLINIVFNLVLPIAALKTLSGEARLGPTLGLIVALAFPVGYFLYDYVQRRTFNIISVLGFVNILLTGGIGLLGASPKWVVLKETALPLAIGLLVLATANTKKSLLKTFLLNDQVFDLDKINARVDTPEKKKQLEAEFRVANWLLFASFVLSAALNCALAYSIVKSQGGTEAYNQEMATLNWVSYLVITVPTLGILIYALMKLVKALTRLTDLTFEQLLHEHHQQKARS